MALVVRWWAKVDGRQNRLRIVAGGALRLPWVCYPTIITGRQGWAVTPSMLQLSRLRAPPSQTPPYPPGLNLRLVRRSSEIYQRPVAVRIVVEPATQSGQSGRHQRQLPHSCDGMAGRGAMLAMPPTVMFSQI